MKSRAVLLVGYRQADALRMNVELYKGQWSLIGNQELGGMNRTGSFHGFDNCGNPMNKLIKLGAFEFDSIIHL